MVRSIFAPRKEAENTTLAEAFERYSREVLLRKYGPNKKDHESSCGRPVPSANDTCLLFKALISQLGEMLG